MEERDNLLLLGFSLEYDYKEKDRAKMLYEKYISAHPFFNKYSALVDATKARMEISDALNGGIYAAVKFDKYLSIVEELVRYYGGQGLIKALGSRFRLNFKNFENISILHKKIKNESLGGQK